MSLTQPTSAACGIPLFLERLDLPLMNPLPLEVCEYICDRIWENPKLKIANSIKIEILL